MGRLLAASYVDVPSPAAEARRRCGYGRRPAQRRCRRSTYGSTTRARERCAPPSLRRRHPIDVGACCHRRLAAAPDARAPPTPPPLPPPAAPTPAEAAAAAAAAATAAAAAAAVDLSRFSEHLPLEIVFGAAPPAELAPLTAAATDALHRAAAATAATAPPETAAAQLAKAKARSAAAARGARRRRRRRRCRAPRHADGRRRDTHRRRRRRCRRPPGHWPAAGCERRRRRRRRRAVAWRWVRAQRAAAFTAARRDQGARLRPVSGALWRARRRGERPAAENVRRRRRQRHPARFPRGHEIDNAEAIFRHQLPGGGV